MPIEPFNLDKEREEGAFDAGGGYIPSNFPQVKDAWLESIDGKPCMQADHACVTVLPFHANDLNSIQMYGEVTVKLPKSACFPELADTSCIPVSAFRVCVHCAVIHAPFQLTTRPCSPLPHLPPASPSHTIHRKPFH